VEPNDANIVEITIIDGNEPNDPNFGSTVTFSNGEDVNSVLMGFTITGGTDGVYCSGSSHPIITNCIIRDNNDAGVDCNQAEPVVRNCWIYENYRGITFDGGHIVVKNNTIVDNNNAGIYNTDSGTYPASFEAIKIGWATDSHTVDSNIAPPCDGLDRTYCPQSHKIKIPFFMGKMEDWNPDFAVFTGDNNHDTYGDPEVNIQDNLKVFLDSAYYNLTSSEPFIPDYNDPYNVPVHIVIGNHETLDPYKDYNETECTKGPWRDMIDEANQAPANAYQNGGTAYYSFSQNGYHFVVFDCMDCMAYNDERVDQLQWLAEDLEKHSDERVFVFSHYPVNEDYEGQVFADAGNVEAFFHGHNHMNDYSYSDGIHQYQLDDMSDNDANSDPNATIYATIEIDTNGLVTLTGFGDSDYSMWADHNSFELDSGPTITNCIIWDNSDDLYDCNATYCCIKDNDSGTGNIGNNPCFVNSDSNDFHLKRNSPCVNAGSPNKYYTYKTDIDGEARVQGRRIDMGADEWAYRVYNIDQDKRFKTIKDAINASNYGDVIEVSPGTYEEYVDMHHKSVTLRSIDPNDRDVVEATIIAKSNADLVTFYDNDSNTTLAGFTLKNGDVGIILREYSEPTIRNCIIKNNNEDGINSWDSSPTIINCEIYENDKGFDIDGGSPTIRNNTIVNNTSYGIDSSGGGSPDISNCIIWGHNDNDIHSNFSATYSCIEDCNDANGVGNICGDANDPLFVDDANDDYHLEAKSPCIDAGDPSGDYDGETDIDGEVREQGNEVDMGADEFNWVSIGDFAGGYDIDFADFAVFALAWLTEDGDPNYNSLCDISVPADRAIDEIDLKVFTENWLEGK